MVISVHQRAADWKRRGTVAKTVIVIGCFCSDVLLAGLSSRIRNAGSHWNYWEHTIPSWAPRCAGEYKHSLYTAVADKSLHTYLPAGSCIEQFAGMEVIILMKELYQGLTAHADYLKKWFFFYKIIQLSLSGAMQFGIFSSVCFSILWM